MSHIDDILKAKNILSSALSSAFHSLSQNNVNVSEAKSHIKMAINKLDSAAKTQIRKKQQTTETKGFAQTSKTTTGNYAGIGDASVLKRLDSMITEQQRAINELEKKVQNPDHNDNASNQDDDFLMD